MILATISQKGKSISFSGSAFHELELAIQLFEKITDPPAIRHSMVSVAYNPSPRYGLIGLIPFRFFSIVLEMKLLRYSSISP